MHLIVHQKLISDLNTVESNISGGTSHLCQSIVSTISEVSSSAQTWGMTDQLVLY